MIKCLLINSEIQRVELLCLELKCELSNLSVNIYYILINGASN